MKSDNVYFRCKMESEIKSLLNEENIGKECLSDLMNFEPLPRPPTGRAQALKQPQTSPAFPLLRPNGGSGLRGRSAWVPAPLGRPEGQLGPGRLSLKVLSSERPVLTTCMRENPVTPYYLSQFLPHLPPPDIFLLTFYEFKTIFPD
ncbi:hypothetical protein J1605_008417 [Eschrichtius robustus]|uniref:Uncharacterized protein n=1 Tax=Eschrichtius robustus TaxID=9764 RepID=A0AB34GZV4_ESCRO|nr:hypothetical protein J1605_008417 [Eschrichtius robustus]